MRRRILKILAVFFTVMICCTVIARAADSITVARVKVVNPKKGKLTSTIQGTGVIETGTQWSQSLPENQKVKKILEKPGSKISAGQPVVQLDMEYLEELLDKKGREIEKLEIRLKQQEIELQGEARTPETENVRIALEGAGRSLANAQDAYDWAEEAYHTYISSAPEDMDEEQAAKYQEEKSSLQAKMETAEETLKSQREAYEQAEDSYELAALNEENVRKNINKKAESDALSVKSIQVDLDGARKELEKLRLIQEQEGKVCASEEGVLKSIGVSQGAVTTGTEQIVIGTGGYVASGSLSAADAGSITAGDIASITVSGQSKDLEVQITQIGQLQTADDKESLHTEKSADEKYLMVWRAPLESGEYPLGMSFTYKVVKESEGSYDQTIPLGALRESNGKSWVLVVRETAGILGNGYVAEEVLVTVIDKDNTKAAIQSTLGNNIQIISESSKYVKGGDRIRIED